MDLINNFLYTTITLVIFGMIFEQVEGDIKIFNDIIKILTNLSFILLPILIIIKIWTL